MGIPLALVVTGANAHDNPILPELLRARMIKAPKGKQQNLCLDKAYHSTKTIGHIKQNHYTPHVRSRGEERIAKMKGGKKPRRWVVERTNSWFNRFRKLLVRFEKDSRNYLALLIMAAVLIIFRKLLMG